MIYFTQLVIVTLSGLYTSLWGAFKDSPYETFKPKTFPRSIYFNLGIYLFLLSLPFSQTKIISISLVSLFFLIMGIERFLSEIYKGFFRTEDQTKYFIPSRFTFFGKPVHSNFLRYMIGILLVGITLMISLLPYTITQMWQFALVSYITGSLVALGGAYKDAPFEGFHILKFQRSGLVLLFFSPLFYFLGPISLGFLIFMNGGLERFLVEYYKTYIQRNMSGKFKPDTQRIQKYLDSREKFHYTALVLIAFVIAMYIYEVL